MEETKNKIRFWRGKRESYNKIIKPDFWTRYSVLEPNGVWHEYFGTNLISTSSGALAPVLDIVDKLPEAVNPGDRYLLKTTENGTVKYQIYEFSPIMGENGYLLSVKMTDLGDLTVRIKSKGLKAFQVVDGVLKTYDEVDCGLY